MTQAGGKPKKPFRSNKFKDKRRDSSSHPGGPNNKECSFLSPCFNEVATGDGKGGVNAQGRLEVVDMLIDWHNRVLREVDHRKLTKLLNTPGRKCLTKDLTDVLSTLRGKLEEVEKKLLPHLLDKHMHYESLLLAAKQQQAANKFTDEERRPVALDDGGETLRELLQAGRLRYATFPMNKILPSLNAALSTRLKLHLYPDDSNDTYYAASTCDQPTMLSLYYSPKSDLFYAGYMCENSESDLKYNLRFKLAGMTIDPGRPVEFIGKDPSEDTDEFVKLGDTDAYAGDDWFGRMVREEVDGSLPPTSVMEGGRGRPKLGAPPRNANSGRAGSRRLPRPSSPKARRPAAAVAPGTKEKRGAAAATPKTAAAPPRVRIPKKVRG